MITYKAKIPEVLKNIYFTKKQPVSLIHFLTNRCNARCSFCFIDFDNPKTFKGELSIQEIEKMTKNLGNTLLNNEQFIEQNLKEEQIIYAETQLFKKCHL